MWLTKPQDATVTRSTDSFEQGEYIFWDVNSWQKIKVPLQLSRLRQQKFYLSYDMLEQRDVSLPYEEANPEAAKLERGANVETRKISLSKQPPEP
jgi:hypothetical protein